MDQCRNCECSQLNNLGFKGILASFFLKRVLRAEIVIRTSSDPRKRAVQRLTRIAHRLMSRVHPPAVAVELQSCVACSFVQTRFPFSDEAIGRLYSDYRSESYNRERTHYEPSYAAIAAQIGNHREGGGLDRVAGTTAWIRSRVDLSGATMLDFGGADGRYLPAFTADKFVYEISDIQPVPGVARIADESALRTYRYVQLSHVLEHVTYPLQLVRKVAALVEPNGYLLVEVPQDLDSALIRRLQQGAIDTGLAVHEHINYYSVLAVEKLCMAAGLAIVALEAIPVVSPLAKQDFIRCLARKPSAESPIL